MKNQLFLSALIALTLFSCGKKTPSGVKITSLRKGDGVALKSGQYLIMNMTFKDGKDSVWSDTKKNGYPMIIQMQDSVPKGDGVLEVFQMLTKGDSVTFQVPAKVLFEKTFRQPIPAKVDSTSKFTFNIGLTDVMSLEQVQQFQTKLVAQQNEKFKKEQEVQLAKDTVLIDNYLKEKNVVAQKTVSGLRYVITKPGKGENAKSNQSVKVNYTGYLLNGKFFDSSSEAVAKANNVFAEGRPYEPLTLTIGAQQVIPGWEEALTLMNKGAKATFYIPSTLAYGPATRGEVIGANEILVFDMELVDIIKNK